MGNSHGVTVSIEVDNQTDCVLTNPDVTVESGVITTPPVAIPSCKKGLMEAKKCGHTATGSFGVVSWEIKGKDRRLVIMWSAPYNFNHYSNWLAVGLTRSRSNEHKSEWIQQMYYGVDDNRLGFRREEYYRNVRTVLCEDDQFCVSGTMGTSHQAVVKVVLSAKSNEKGDTENFTS